MTEAEFLEELKQLRRETEDNRIERRIAMAALEKQVQELDMKVDQLMRIANIGQGVMWTLLRVGGLVAIISGAFAWLWDHLNWK